MKPKGKKQEELNELKKDLNDAKNMFVTQFQGMTVAQDTELRQKIRGTNSKYRVVKNTLARKAAEGTPAEGMVKSFDGSTAIAYNGSDPVAPSKEELIAKLLFLINSPAQRLVVAMNGVARNLAVVLGQAIEKKKFQE